MGKPRVGIIGLGVMGRRMVRFMTGDGRFEMAGAWDPAAAARTEAAREFPALPLLDGPKAVIEGCGPDLVYIACPPVAHREYALAAADAGKAVFCEKPLGIDLADSRALVAGLEARGARHAVNFLQATSHAVALTAERIKAGELGAIVGADIVLHFSRWPRDWQAGADWLRFKAEGGFTREVVSHFVFLAGRLLGPPRLVDAHTRHPADPALCETHVAALLDCGGVPVQVAGSAGGVGPDRVEFTIWGDRRSHRLHDWFWLQSSDGGDWVREIPAIDDLRAANVPRLMDAVLAMRDGRPHPLPSARDAFAVQEIVEGMLRA